MENRRMEIRSFRGLLFTVESVEKYSINQNGS